ncbi:MAG: NAD-dependent epimerase/dehydratase family protein [Lachnospirales bacterium]
MYTNKTFLRDIENEASDLGIEWEKISNVLITGATGLIGSHLSFALAKRGIKVYAVGRNKEKLEQLPAIPIVIDDITDAIEIEDEIDYVIHGANSTQSREFIENPVDITKSIICGTMNVLDFSLKKQVKGVVYLSSVEVYGKTEKYPLFEEDLGYLDLSNIRNCYPEAKRIAENLCASYSKQFGLQVKIARLTQILGSGVDYKDNRLFGYAARAIVEKKDIVLNTKGGTVRSYCYVSDAVRAVLYILTKGEEGQTYNVADKDTECSISEIVELIASKNNIKVVYDIKDTGGLYPVETRTVINTEKIEKIGWCAKSNELHKDLNQ